MHQCQHKQTCCFNSQQKFNILLEVVFGSLGMSCTTEPGVEGSYQLRAVFNVPSREAETRLQQLLRI